MSDPTRRSAEDVIDEPAKVQFEAFIDQHRLALGICLEGLTEQQARRSLVPSKTTLLGLVNHAILNALTGGAAGHRSHGQGLHRRQDRA